MLTLKTYFQRVPTFSGAALLCVLLLGLISSKLSAQSNEALAAEMIIVVNRSDPDSLELGQYYARQRGIPESRIVQLSAPTSETITVAQYVETIANPLLNILLDKEWVKGVKDSALDDFGRERLSVSIHQIPYVVLMRGLPLRIANDPSLLEANSENFPEQFRVNNASVDGELALLLAPPSTSMTALIPNPYFEKQTVSRTDANRILRISRLDGPTRSDVTKLIDRTLEVEKIGLMGRAYIDTGGPHQKGDTWIRAAGEMLEAAYFDTDFEGTKRVMDHRDRLDAPAIYMGWYRRHAHAQWRAPRWSVPPGAIGFHLHSFSGTSLRTTQTWLGAFIAQGYCATVGNVYEPYLEYTHRPQILLAHLLAGGNFGDAVAQSLPALSWQCVAIGDPLYRPFKVSLEDQLTHSENASFAAYASIREINRLLSVDGLEAAITFARAKFVTQPSLALAYRLAQLYAQADKDREAVEALKIIRYISKFAADEFVLVQKIADFLHKRGESELAFTLYQNILEERDLDKWLKVSLYEGGAPIAAAQGEPVIASRWQLEARNLKAPPTPNPAKKK
ncbi:TIGR03790 family protein [Coraliomargarita sp. SDUM461004]|uniref:TIGR03790 family protein n=1 Tax=Thalassobacterium sedimentorum TaxID=3041258 RepID=A0ABU1AIT4_9BACT|nr:TIGR03790 family protein [Coraliomargarita sp. SDUM461004]MDQ8194539.1 TIGR03790 family protein [Coraliomargarita sp. SDUM461004]